jgi:hypothetical protein
MPKVDLDAARFQIREIIKSGCVDYTLHCRERMYLRGVQMDDVLYLLNWGSVEPGEEEGDSENRVFRVLGTDVEGEPLIATVKIIDFHRMLIITVF